MNQTQKVRKRGSKNDSGSLRTATGIVVGVLLIIAGLLSLLRGCGTRLSGAPTGTTTASGIVYDESAVEGGWGETDLETIIGSLNEKVEEGMINISMNTSPVFADGTSEGNLMIVNESVNRYPQVVEITRNDTQEVVYRSGAIPVGSKIESARLSAALDAGTYACTAMFSSVDPDTGAVLGSAGAVIRITVLG